jgi:putative hydrolase
MEFYGDYHCHSLYSDGRADMEEMVRAAARRGFMEVAITDHGPGALGIGVKTAAVYREVRERAEELNSRQDHIRVLVGAEANITSLAGDLDLPEELAQEMDVLIVGMHPYTVPETWQDGCRLFAVNHLRHLGQGWRQRAINANTKAITACLNHNDVDILAHPGLFFQVDVEEVAWACVKNQVLFEINCGHEYPDLSDIIIAERVGVDFIIDSDAHFPDSVGKFEYGQSIVSRLALEPERVANLRGGEKNDVPRLQKY